MKVFGIVACHNRKALTLGAISRARAGASIRGIDLHFVVFDDGSTDGTAEALRADPSLEVIQGDGTAFWAMSMSIAEAKVLSGSGAVTGDYVMWLNDDVLLDLSSWDKFLEAAKAEPGSILVGAMRDPASGTVTYSGLQRKGPHPLGFERVPPGDDIQRVDTFNGNLVFVPLAVASLLGGIDGHYAHALADIDYGIRAARSGVPVRMMPGTLGTCSANPRPRRRSMIDDWKSFIGPKGGGNFASVRRYLRKGHKHTWPFFVAVSYCLWWGRRLRAEPL